MRSADPLLLPRYTLRSNTTDKRTAAASVQSTGCRPARSEHSACADGLAGERSSNTVTQRGDSGGGERARHLGPHLGLLQSHTYQAWLGLPQPGGPPAQHAVLQLLVSMKLPHCPTAPEAKIILSPPHTPEVHNGEYGVPTAMLLPQGGQHLLWAQRSAQGRRDGRDQDNHKVPLSLTSGLACRWLFSSVRYVELLGFSQVQRR